MVNYRTKKIEETYEIKTNNTNCIEINKKLIKPEIFFTTKEYLGIPIYASLKNNYLSFEHTHPPHEYILSKNKFVKVNELKKELNESIKSKPNGFIQAFITEIHKMFSELDNYF